MFASCTLLKEFIHKTCKKTYHGPSIFARGSITLKIVKRSFMLLWFVQKEYIVTNIKSVKRLHASSVSSLHLPDKVKTRYVQFRLHVSYLLFYLRKFLRILARDQSSFVTKSSIFCIKHMNIIFQHGNGLS